MMILLGGLAWSGLAQAIPAFARQYQMSCSLCHSAFPRLSAFGETFRDDMSAGWCLGVMSGGCSSTSVL